VIFGHKKAVPTPGESDVAIDEELSEPDEELDDESLDATDAADDEDEDDEDDEDDEAVEELDQWVQFDLSQDWREDGPFDIDEVDLSADDVERIDLGAVIITPEKGMTIKLVADATTQQVMHVLVEHGPQAAVQITVFAAPADGSDYCAEIRQDIIDHTDNAKVIEMVEGPFGTELRRVLAVTDDQGREGFAPLRDWLVAGPRWVLDVRLIGQAALDGDNKGVAAVFEEFVHNIVVRRGDQAMVPGTVVPLKPVGQE